LFHIDVVHVILICIAIIIVVELGVIIIILPPYMEMVPSGGWAPDESLDTGNAGYAITIETDTKADEVLGVGDPVEFAAKKCNVHDIDERSLLWLRQPHALPWLDQDEGIIPVIRQDNNNIMRA
jgi:hypothetical protein